MLCVIVFVVQIHCTWQVDILGNGMLLVNINALPEVFKKVAEAKGLIASGKARTASEASKMCGISRSAYYKYKDSVFEYSNPFGRIVSLYAVLRDKGRRFVGFFVGALQLRLQYPDRKSGLAAFGQSVGIGVDPHTGRLI